MRLTRSAPPEHMCGLGHLRGLVARCSPHSLCLSNACRPHHIMQALALVAPACHQWGTRRHGGPLQAVQSLSPGQMARNCCPLPAKGPLVILGDSCSRCQMCCHTTVS